MKKSFCFFLQKRAWFVFEKKNQKTFMTPHMDPQSGRLLDGVPLAEIVRRVGTPAWVYGAETLRARARVLTAALAPVGARIHYAVKANDHLAILGLLAAEGIGADVVSQGELARALRAGIPPGRIVFSGVGKTPTELAAAIAANIGQINVESAEELAMLSATARTAGRPATIALRLNPDIDAGTHDKIATGRAGDKFGIPYADVPRLYRLAVSDPWLRPVGLALHIGSQIASMAPFRAAYARAADLVRSLRGEGLPVTRVDCGGGLGISYGNGPAASPYALAGVIAHTLAPLGLELMTEPGRWLVGPAGLLLARVVLVKQAVPHRIVVLDAAMNDLLRPAMYGAYHRIVPIASDLCHAPCSPADIVGPVCESSDVFGRARPMPPLAAGDTLAILDAGAYGAVMSSTYNARPLAPIVLVQDGKPHLIREREDLSALWRGEIVPATAVGAA